MSERDEGTPPADRSPGGPASGEPPSPQPPPPDPPPQWPAPPAPPQWPAPGEPPYGGQADQPPPAPPYGPPPGQWPPAGYAPPPPPGPGPIHPLTVGRAFSVGWSLFRFRWKALIGVFALVTIPAYVLQALWLAAYGERLAEWQTTLALWQLGTPGDPPLPSLPLEVFPLLLMINIVLGVASLVAVAAVVSILGWTYGGGWRSWRQAFGDAIKRMPTLVGIALLGVAALIGIIALTALLAAVAVLALGGGLGVFLALVVAVSGFVAVMFVVLRWAFAVHAVMLEGRGAVESLGRSWRLVSGSTWRLLGYLLLIWLVLMLLGLVAALLQLLLFGLGVDLRTGLPDPFDPSRVIGQMAITMVFTIAVTPWMLAVLLLLYYDLRLRDGEVLTPPPA